MVSPILASRVFGVKTGAVFANTYRLSKGRYYIVFNLLTVYVVGAPEFEGEGDAAPVGVVNTLSTTFTPNAVPSIGCA